MSYRAFKRLLGETSLERKCRFLFGAGILLLITASFCFYAYLTEQLAKKQATNMGRLLVNWIVTKDHLQRLRVSRWEWDADAGGAPAAEAKGAAPSFGDPQWGQLRGALLEDLALDDQANAQLPPAARAYRHVTIKPQARSRINQPEDSYEGDLLKEFLADRNKQEDSREPAAGQKIYYYGAVRATPRCLACHPATADEGQTLGALKEGDLMALVRINIPTDAIEEGVHQNRAWLITIALVTALLIMAGSYLIVRYVIVKPVKHLKEVSDAISAGELNVRSEIQTGDEFEDLSHAFNRMLRNLVSMQDRLRTVNVDLDRKVDQLAQANLALYESNRLKSDFLATMSHELRTPLSSILGFSEVLLSADPLSDKQKRWVGNIQSSGSRLLNLINDILDLAKIEAGKMEIRLSDFSLHDLCEGQLAMFRPLAEKKKIDLRGHVEPDLPALRQDAGKLQQILSNLLSNSVKFTPEGGRVVLRGVVQAAWVELTVADSGVGIAPDEQELVFEKFRQSGNPLTREHAGTGLGLSIVRELAKLLGGQVTLESVLGRGSTFTVRLPVHLGAEPRAGHGAGAGAGRPPGAAAEDGQPAGADEPTPAHLGAGI
jgi:signal transduction histidine kinase